MFWEHCMFTPAFRTKPSCHSCRRELTQSADRFPLVILSPKQTIGGPAGLFSWFFKFFFLRKACGVCWSSSMVATLSMVIPDKKAAHPMQDTSGSLQKADTSSHTLRAVRVRCIRRNAGCGCLMKDLWGDALEVHGKGGCKACGASGRSDIAQNLGCFRRVLWAHPGTKQTALNRFQQVPKKHVTHHSRAKRIRYSALTLASKSTRIRGPNQFRRPVLASQQMQLTYFQTTKIIQTLGIVSLSLSQATMDWDIICGSL